MNKEERKNLLAANFQANWSKKVLISKLQQKTKQVAFFFEATMLSFSVYITTFFLGSESASISSLLPNDDRADGPIDRHCLF